MDRCSPAGSAAHRRDDKGSAPAGSSASGMASRSPEPDNQAQPSAGGSRPSGGLPERQLEQHLDRKAELDCVRRENTPPDCFLIFLTPRRPVGVLDGPHSVRATPYSHQARPAGTRACGAQRCRRTSSSCNSERAWACSCNPSNRMDSRCESFIARVLQQYLAQAAFPIYLLQRLVPALLMLPLPSHTSGLAVWRLGDCFGTTGRAGAQAFATGGAGNVCRKEWPGNPGCTVLNRFPSDQMPLIATATEGRVPPEASAQRRSAPD